MSDQPEDREDRSQVGVGATPAVFAVPLLSAVEATSSPRQHLATIDG
ncbi:MAG TPA: hypothetical protein VMV92_21085 [Streptosporangiaceae bacterium]|nr:hypothetical protein [Streptosporangiaceae bacterium]